MKLISIILLAALTLSGCASLDKIQHQIKNALPGQEQPVTQSITINLPPEQVARHAPDVKRVIARAAQAADGSAVEVSGTKAERTWIIQQLLAGEGVVRLSEREAAKPSITITKRK